MKVLLLTDVYKLGRAGEVKKVADGYGRNYLLPQGLAVLATPGALKQAEHIKNRFAVQRAEINKEMSGVSEKINGMIIAFGARASETGKLYGSITTQMIADAISSKAGVEIDKRDIETQPLRALGEHVVPVRLTVDLIPEIKVIVHKEGEVVGTGAPEPEPVTEIEATPEIVEEAIAQAEEIAEAEESVSYATEEIEKIEEIEETEPEETLEQETEEQAFVEEEEKEEEQK
jgi:large subunit ribosomal protein L9